MEKTALLKSQRELIALRIAHAQEARDEVQATINNAAKELGLDPKEMWRLSSDGQFFERPELPEIPKK